MRKIFFALVVILVPMLVLSEVEGLCVGTGSIPVHAQEKVPPFEKGGAGGIVAEFPFPASEEALFWGEEEKNMSATK
ncbi:MAG: hypothetical protein HY279_01335 [Nitrospinae bacterium]|nr:hypothetical protein [Nitrospinota bacterium]